MDEILNCGTQFPKGGVNVRALIFVKIKQNAENIFLDGKESLYFWKVRNICVCFPGDPKIDILERIK